VSPSAPGRKAIVTTGKVLVAAALLAWVLSAVHWRDYAVAKDGKTYAVLSAKPAGGEPTELEISTGLLWWGHRRTMPVDHFQPIPGTSRVVRAGFATTVANLKVPLLVVAFAVNVLNMVIMASRWWLLLRVVSINISPWEALRLSFLGQYFSVIVPGTVGGDLVKAYYVSKHTAAKAAALVSVIMDRIMGLTELTLMATVMLLVVYFAGLSSVETLKLPAVIVAIVVAVLIAAFVFLFSQRFRRLLRLDRLYRRLPMAHHIAAAAGAVHLYRGNVRRLIEAMGITLLGHVAWIGSMVLVAASLSLATPWYNFFLYVPLIYTIGAVPLTPGGLGLVEKFFVVFFVTPLVTASEVVALALLIRVMPVFWSLPGAIVAVTGAKVPKAAEMKTELGLADQPAGTGQQG